MKLNIYPNCRELHMSCFHSYFVTLDKLLAFEIISVDPESMTIVILFEEDLE